MRGLFKLIFICISLLFGGSVFASRSIQVYLYPSNVILKKGEVIGVVVRGDFELESVSLEDKLYFSPYKIGEGTFYSLVPIPHTVLTNFNLGLRLTDGEEFYTNLVIPIEVVVDPISYAKRKPKVIKDIVVSNSFVVKTNRFSFYGDLFSEFVGNKFITTFCSPFPNSEDIISEIKDGYGVNRSRGGIISGRIHLGVDIPKAWGTKVFSVFDGIVISTGKDRRAGKFVAVYHGYGISSVYMHLSKILVRKGQYITTNDIIGLVGSTGRSTGAHLHFGVSINGIYVDPVSFFKNDYSPFSIISNGLVYEFNFAQMELGSGSLVYHE